MGSQARVYRSLFSLPAESHYLNCAFMAPASKRVAMAGRRAIERIEAPARLGVPDFFEPGTRVRRLFADIIGAPDADRVAIIPSVSYAMATIARNTPLASGQAVVVVEEQFPSVVYTWRRACREAGATLQTVAAPETAGSRAEAWNAVLLDAINERTAVVAIPELLWTDGLRFDLDAVGARARTVGARFVIDGTQSVGALPFDVGRTRPDAVVCAGYKWLTGPYSVGAAWYGPAFDGGTPIEENWITRAGSDRFNELVNYREDYRPGAIRYDVGERSNFILLPMFEAALEQVREWGPETVATHTRDLTAATVPRLRDLGCRIEDERWRAGHLLGVRLPAGVDIEQLGRTLAARQVSVSLRGGAIRVAPHLYNDGRDLDVLIDVLAGAVRAAAVAVD
ncbi:MAG: aminotransferase class V-fold PLP-dependent enzyme [Acidobacteria bacterium]|nr:aminotransferase class V-fold PLP-dependent enzyme [Acidobacteriota bacterium]